MPVVQKKMLTITEAAAAMGVSFRTLADKIKAGEIRAEYTGRMRKRARYISAAEVERWTGAAKGVAA